MGEKKLFYWLALSMAPGVGCVLFKRLTDGFGSPEEVFHATSKDLERIEGVGATVVAALRKFGWKGTVERELEKAEKLGVRLVTWDDAEYPSRLRDIYDPPPLLYIRGSLQEDDSHSVAVVGSRYPTIYGLMQAERIARGLGRRGITVVSGLARGIDSAAHRGAILSGGRTVAVLGCGIDIIYPPENQDLFEEVAAHGAVLSEFPFGTPPESDHFPIRNRVISGISLGVAVVEATLRSGSLITARFALEQGREVFAVPGNADSARSAGTNGLIRDGAKMVTQVEDILEEFHDLCQFPIRDIPPGANLSEEEIRILSIIGSRSKHIDEVIAQSALSSARVSSGLLSLELGGYIKQLPGMRFIKA